MFKCNKCQKEFKNLQGLSGHGQFTHSSSYSKTNTESQDFISVFEAEREARKLTRNLITVGIAQNETDAGNKIKRWMETIIRKDPTFLIRARTIYNDEKESMKKLEEYLYYMIQSGWADDFQDATKKFLGLAVLEGM